MDWEFFSKRRRLSLEQFVDGLLPTEAVAKFDEMGLDLPKDDELEKLFKERLKVSNDSTEVSESDAAVDATPQLPVTKTKKATERTKLRTKLPVE
jgi:hypothetical protein